MGKFPEYGLYAVQRMPLRGWNAEDSVPYIIYSADFLTVVRLKMVTDMGAIWKQAEY